MLFTFASISSALAVDAVLATTMFALLGIIILMAAYKIFDMINPIDFDKEIANNNMALGIMMAGFFIAISIIIASAIFG